MVPKSIKSTDTGTFTIQEIGLYRSYKLTLETRSEFKPIK